MQHPQPSPWSAPRPDGPLAAALQRAQAARSAVATERCGGAFDEPLPLPADLQPAALPSVPRQQTLDHDIEALAREAQARDGAREALAIALEWPDDASGRRRDRGRRRWIGLGLVVVLAGAAAAIAFALAPDDAPAGKAQGDLKLERQLQPPRASSPGAAVR